MHVSGLGRRPRITAALCLSVSVPMTALSSLRAASIRCRCRQFLADCLPLGWSNLQATASCPGSSRDLIMIPHRTARMLTRVLRCHDVSPGPRPRRHLYPRRRPPDLCSRPLEADPPTVSAFVDDHAALIGNYTPSLGEAFLADGFADTSSSINALAGPAIADGHAAVTFASKRAFMRSQAARPGSPLAFSPLLPAHAIRMAPRWRPGGRRRFGPEACSSPGSASCRLLARGGL